MRTAFESGTRVPAPNTQSMLRTAQAVRSDPIVGGHMIRIIRANIDRFKLLLEDETDPTKRALLSRLLVEEEQKLEAAEKTPAIIKKAF